MKTKEAVFRVSTGLLSGAHIVLQSLADLTLEAEAKIVKRTGYWHEGEEMQLTDRQLLQYRAQRKRHTKLIQSQMSDKMRIARAAFNKQFKIVES